MNEGPVSGFVNSDRLIILTGEYYITYIRKYANFGLAHSKKKKLISLKLTSAASLLAPKILQACLESIVVKWQHKKMLKVSREKNLEIHFQGSFLYLTYSTLHS